MIARHSAAYHSTYNGLINLAPYEWRHRLEEPEGRVEYANLVNKTRRSAARALREYRSAGRAVAAKAFRYELYRMGYPIKFTP